jgi:hypothetical protein
MATALDIEDNKDSSEDSKPLKATSKRQAIA